MADRYRIRYRRPRRGNAAEIAGLIDNAEVGDAQFNQLGGCHHPAQAAADDRDFGIFGQGLTMKVRIGVGVVIEVPENAGKVAVLVGAIRAQPFFSLSAILCFDLVDGKLRRFVTGIAHSVFPS